MRVLVTGGTSGFGQKLVGHFGPDALGLGRGNGWNLSALETHKKVADISLDFYVFINFAFISCEVQLNLLQQVFGRWTQETKKGLIVNFGTINTYYKRNTLNRYAIQKASLDEACRQMSKMAISGETQARVTNLRPGFLDMEKNQGKSQYSGHGLSVDQVGDLVNLLFKHETLVYPEVIVDTRQKYGE